MIGSKYPFDFISTLSIKSMQSLECYSLQTDFLGQLVKLKLLVKIIAEDRTLSSVWLAMEFR